jgi:hypothetical protein
MGQERLMTIVLADWINCGREWPATIKTFEKKRSRSKAGRGAFFFCKTKKNTLHAVYDLQHETHYQAK